MKSGPAHAGPWSTTCTHVSLAQYDTAAQLHKNLCGLFLETGECSQRNSASAKAVVNQHQNAVSVFSRKLSVQLIVMDPDHATTSAVRLFISQVT